MLRDGFVSVSEARDQLKVSKIKIIELVRESGVKLYSDPLDKRKKLIRNEDLEKLIEPKEMV